MKRYFDTFSRKQIKVFLYEDWQGDGAELLKGVFRFLCVDDTVAVPESAGRHNATEASRFNAKGVARPALSPELRAKLAEEYREEIERLENLIGRDLSAWL